MKLITTNKKFYLSRFLLLGVLLYLSFSVGASEEIRTPEISVIQIAHVDKRAVIREAGESRVVKEGDLLANNQWQVKQIMPSKIMLNWAQGGEYAGTLLFVELKKHGESKKTVLSSVLPGSVESNWKQPDISSRESVMPDVSSGEQKNVSGFGDFERWIGDEKPINEK